MPPNAESKESSRLEAISDGVFAVAITLLVLEIRPPSALRDNDSLALALLRDWPSFLAFGLSFTSIGVMWMNHHRMFKLITRYDEGLAIANGVLLFLVTFVPFPTSIFAQHLTTPHASHAAAFYSATFVALSIAFNFLAAYIHRRHLMNAGAEATNFAKGLRKRYLVGPGMYLLLTGVAFINVYACLGMHILLAGYWTIPPNTWIRKPPRDSDTDESQQAAEVVS